MNYFDLKWLHMISDCGSEQDQIEATNILNKIEEIEQKNEEMKESLIEFIKLADEYNIQSRGYSYLEMLEFIQRLFLAQDKAIKLTDYKGEVISNNENL